MRAASPARSAGSRAGRRRAADCESAGLRRCQKSGAARPRRRGRAAPGALRRLRDDPPAMSLCVPAGRWTTRVIGAWARDPDGDPGASWSVSGRSAASGTGSRPPRRCSGRLRPGRVRPCATAPAGRRKGGSRAPAPARRRRRAAMRRGRPGRGRRLRRAARAAGWMPITPLRTNPLHQHRQQGPGDREPGLSTRPGPGF